MSDEKLCIGVSTLGAILLGFIAPLIIYLTKKEQLTEPAKSLVIGALNFEITLAIVSIIVSLIPFIGLLFVLLIALFNCIILIIAFVAGNKGNEYKFPLTYNFVK
ncbi:MAG TPA: DUF4870 domain-containing protein [Candidatus Limenecus avicola]|jgi:hypothetical protein|uniref:DUF4870 domain-containing protein n=1 Tax=Candidatus Limenecus avicola TaxID=2840847 RepID=A0A9D1SS20_9CLOT|nr:DUF4870 domain-containing protein [Candidatus Limenecus avicola]